MREVLAITKALADQNRLRILMMLEERELCVCQIIEVLGLAASTVSKHLSLLHAARLVESRKNGRWIYYRRSAEASVTDVFRWLTVQLAHDAAIQADRRTLADVLTIAPETLCHLQSERSKSSSSAPAIPAAARWPKGGRAT